MRVISGICRGRKLVPISGKNIRPTSDRVKEAVFNIIGPRILDAVVLDLFCGTGALGIEALSRGAEKAVFADINTETTLKNIELCRLKNQSTTLQTDVLLENSLVQLKDQLFDYIFIDPPYGKKNIEATLLKPDFLSLLHQDSMIVAEHSIKETLDIQQDALDIFRQKKYSKTMISFIKLQN